MTAFSLFESCTHLAKEKVADSNPAHRFDSIRATQTLGSSFSCIHVSCLRAFMAARQKKSDGACAIALNTVVSSQDLRHAANARAKCDLAILTTHLR